MKNDGEKDEERERRGASKCEKVSTRVRWMDSIGIEGNPSIAAQS